MPQIGLPEASYIAEIERAEAAGDELHVEALKVGRYVSLALDPHLNWAEKKRYFSHCLRRHCQAPPRADEEVQRFFRRLAALVRRFAGKEALRLTSQEDDLYAARLGLGQSREDLGDEAEGFFSELCCCGEECPPWFDEADWNQLKLIRDQWL
ncbi:MAG: hypothetical protein ACFCVE_10480 [Phycisphaerae bacterium]